MCTCTSSKHTITNIIFLSSLCLRFYGFDICPHLIVTQHCPLGFVTKLMLNVPVYSVLLTLVPTACVHQLGFLHHSRWDLWRTWWGCHEADIQHTQSTCQFPMLVSHTLTSEPTALVLVCVSHSLHFPFFWVSTSSMQDCRDNLSLLH